jgi:hypothetical protein
LQSTKELNTNVSEGISVNEGSPCGTDGSAGFDNEPHEYIIDESEKTRMNNFIFITRHIIKASNML